MKDKVLVLYKIISQILIIFSVTLLFIAFIGIAVGEYAKEYSTMFSLGNKGMSFDIIFQILLSSVVVSLINQIFYSKKLFKNMMTLWKRVLMIISIIAAIVVFIICFKWFPINLVEAWIGFFVSFGGFFLVSTAIMITKTKREAKKYEELLENYKKKRSKEEDNNESN